jgi:ribosomal protein S18 acetylase RimI-like enzyme
MTFRTALIPDAEAIAALLRQVFTQTYAQAIPPGTLQRYLHQTFSPTALALKLAQPNTLNLIAEANHTIIAFSRVEPQPVPHHPEHAHAAELAKFYVDAEFHGRGLASPLLAETLDAARQRGWRTLWLCVWQHNPRAIAFYRKHGFAQVGHIEVVVEDVVFDDFIMSRSLNPPND